MAPARKPAGQRRPGRRWRPNEGKQSCWAAGGRRPGARKVRPGPPAPQARLWRWKRDGAGRAESPPADADAVDAESRKNGTAAVIVGPAVSLWRIALHRPLGCRAGPHRFHATGMEPPSLGLKISGRSLPPQSTSGAWPQGQAAALGTLKLTGGGLDFRQTPSLFRQKRMF